MRVCLFVLPMMCLGLGCQASYSVGVNGYSSTGQSLEIPQGSSIRAVADSNAPNPILEREIRTKIRKLLTEEGFDAEADPADYYLLFGYGIDSGRAVTGVVPVWYSGFFFDYSFGHRHRRGYMTHVPYSEVVYTRWLVLRLYDGQAYRASQKAEPLWIGEITSAGTDSDLRELVDYMLIVGFEHLGQDTGRRVSEFIPANDDRVWLLR